MNQQQMLKVVKLKLSYFSIKVNVPPDKYYLCLSAGIVRLPRSRGDLAVFQVYNSATAIQSFFHSAPSRGVV